MPNWVVTVIYGIIEGITEFLPISSTGHLILAQYLLGVTKSEFFNIGIQAGAVLAVVFIYWKKLVEITVSLKHPSKADYAKKLALAFGITVVLGFSARAAGVELPEDPWPVTWAVLMGGLLIFVAEWRLKGKEGSDRVGWSVATWVGIAQVVAAVFPGTSRSAATIIAAMLFGMSRMGATEFSFLLGIPTMFAASAYAGMKEVKELGGLPPEAELWDFALGFFVSMVVAFFAVKWLLKFIETNKFTPFAWYRVALGIGMIVWLSSHSGPVD